MPEPTFVAKRIHGDYVVVRSDLPGHAVRWSMATAGIALLGVGARGRGLMSVASLLSGAALTYCGITGRKFSDLLCHRKAKAGDPARAPSYPKETESLADQVPADRVEEAQMESFPASDPPASQRSD